MSKSFTQTATSDFSSAKHSTDGRFIFHLFHSSASFLFTLMAIIMSISLSSGCSKSSLTRPHFTIAVMKDIEPFDFQENGTMKGIDIEILQAIAQDQGFTLDFIPTDLVDILQGVRENRYQGGIGMITLTKWRKDNFDYVTPYYYSGISMAVHSDNYLIHDLVDMEGKTVSFLANSTCEDYVDSVLVARYHVAKRYPCQTIAEAYNMVENGTADAIIDENPMILYHIAQNSPVKLVHKGSLDQPFTMLLTKGKGMELSLMYNLGLQNIQDNGTYDKIIESYLHSNDGSRNDPQVQIRDL